ncbi:alpha-N-acetylgalactosamine-specific lectin-like [Paramisgurnus dabryanus]|uniref:alpha-N-acetylgalactosamine-specific lectin-like n=1 Tax=Paramisgurnus dabryanus TaxID=90735 RepID=UPI003CCFB831
MTQTLYFSVFLIALCSLSECIQRRYHHIKMMKTWTEAQRYCREKYTDLATVNNINDMNQLMKSVDNSLIYDVWIGLHRSSVHEWKWSLDNLILIQMNLSWSEALRYCRENHLDLVSVDSEESQFMVTKVIHQSSTEAVWMGLHYYCQMNLWIWIRGEAVCYQNWAPGNGTKLMDCNTEHRAGAVQSGGDHRWISLPQSHKLNFICIRK